MKTSKQIAKSLIARRDEYDAMMAAKRARAYRALALGGGAAACLIGFAVISSALKTMDREQLVVNFTPIPMTNAPETVPPTGAPETPLPTAAITDAPTDAPVSAAPNPYSMVPFAVPDEAEFIRLIKTVREHGVYESFYWYDTVADEFDLASITAFFVPGKLPQRLDVELAHFIRPIRQGIIYTFAAPRLHHDDGRVIDRTVASFFWNRFDSWESLNNEYRQWMERMDANGETYEFKHIERDGVDYSILRFEGYDEREYVHCYFVKNGELYDASICAEVSDHELLEFVSFRTVAVD